MCVYLCVSLSRSVFSYKRKEKNMRNSSAWVRGEFCILEKRKKKVPGIVCVRVYVYEGSHFVAFLWNSCCFFLSTPIFCEYKTPFFFFFFFFWIIISSCQSERQTFVDYHIMTPTREVKKISKHYFFVLCSIFFFFWYIWRNVFVYVLHNVSGIVGDMYYWQRPPGIIKHS